MDSMSQNTTIEELRELKITSSTDFSILDPEISKILLKNVSQDKNKFIYVEDKGGDVGYRFVKGSCFVKLEGKYAIYQYEITIRNGIRYTKNKDYLSYIYPYQKHFKHFKDSVICALDLTSIKNATPSTLLGWYESLIELFGENMSFSCLGDEQYIILKMYHNQKV